MKRNVIICLLVMIFALGCCFVLDQPALTAWFDQFTGLTLVVFASLKMLKLMCSILRSEDFIEPLDDLKV